jgi:pimeloyl-ACP methyl ester carboxylesterase
VETLEFSSRSKLRLTGQLWHADSARAVVMVHGLMGDKRGNGLFPAAAEALRVRGWSSLCFDQSGCGASDDNLLTPEAALEDIRSAIELMRSMCYRHISLWGLGLGSRLCLEFTRGIDTMVLTDAPFGQTQINWLQHFRSEELEELGGPTRTMEVMRPGLRNHKIAASMLDYFHRFEARKVLSLIRCPVLSMHPPRFVEGSGRSELLRAFMRLLPDRSQHVLVPGTRQSATEDAPRTARFGADWIQFNSTPRVQRWR